MSRGGGKKLLHDRPEHWKVAIPTSIATPVSLILSDPLTGKPKHGARGKLISQLLRGWLEERRGDAIREAEEFPASK